MVWYSQEFSTVHEEYIKDLFNRCVVGRQVGIEVSEVREGYARGRLTLRKEHLNVFGSIHGGILFTFADHIGGACGNTLGKKALLVESSIQYARPVFPESTVLAEATVTHKGKKIGRIDIRVTTEQGDLIALMHMVFFQTDRDHKTKTAQNI
jgi:acyl-CoA thioesterase